jgi:hypothetical protein
LFADAEHPVDVPLQAHEALRLARLRVQHVECAVGVVVGDDDLAAEGSDVPGVERQRVAVILHARVAVEAHHAGACADDDTVVGDQIAGRDTARRSAYVRLPAQLLVELGHVGYSSRA